MSMDPSDVQIATHNFRGLAEHAALLDAILAEHGFSDSLREKMVVVWWQEMWIAGRAGNAADDLNAALKGMLGHFLPEEDED